MRDVIGYYEPMAQAFIDSDWDRAFYLGVPMLHSLIAGIIGRCTGLSGRSAVLLLSCAFYVLTVFPLRSLCRRFLPETWAALGVLLYTTTPVVVKNSCNGTLDPGKVFFVACGAALLLRLRERTRLSDFLLLGISAAGVALIRGEGILTSATFYLWGMYFCLSSSRQRSQRKARLGMLGISIFVFAALIFPRGWQSHVKTGCFALDYRQAPYIRKALKTLLPWKASATAPETTETQLSATPSPICWQCSFTTPEFKEQSGHVHHFTFRELARDFRRGTFSLYILLALLGLGLLKRNLAGPAMLLSIVVVNAICFSMICLAHRYFIVNIVLLMPFVLSGLRSSSAFLARHCPRKAGGILAAAGIAYFGLVLADVARDVVETRNAPCKRCARLVKARFPDIDPTNAICICDDARIAYCLGVRTYPYSCLQESKFPRIRKKYNIAALKLRATDKIPDDLNLKDFQEMPELSRGRMRIFMQMDK